MRFHNRFRAVLLLNPLLALLVTALSACAKAPSASAENRRDESGPGALPPPAAASDLRQLRYEITYERDTRLRARHRDGVRDIGEHTFRLRATYDELVELAPPPDGTTWPEIVPTGTYGPVRGEARFTGIHHFVENAGQPSTTPARLELSGTFSQPEEVGVGFEHLLPYTDHYTAVVRFDLALRGTLSGPLADLGAVATMMHSPFGIDHDDPAALRLATDFTVYPRKTLPRPSGPEGPLHDLQAKSIPPTITLGTLLGVSWQGAELTGQPRGDWTYTLQANHTTGGAEDHEIQDRVTVTIRTVLVTLVAPGGGGRP